MKKINNNELKHINGGGFGLWALGASIVFLIGVVDGYTRPLKCNT